VPPRLPLIEALNALDPRAFGEALTPLFETAPPLANALHARRPFASYAQLIDEAEQLTLQMPRADQAEVLNAHPRIGESPSNVSELSFREQGYAAESGIAADQLQHTYATLARLNAEYEHRFGFKFVVFVNRRPKADIVPILEERLGNPHELELQTGLREMFRIARDRLATLST
jgi:allantoinase